MKITKEEFYEVRGNDYVLSHPEASIRYKRILKWLDLQPGMAICEIGCMFAIIRNLVQRTDVKYTGVDINEKAIKIYSWLLQGRLHHSQRQRWTSL